MNGSLKVGCLLGALIWAVFADVGDVPTFEFMIGLSAGLIASGLFAIAEAIEKRGAR